MCSLWPYGVDMEGSLITTVRPLTLKALGMILLLSILFACMSYAAGSLGKGDEPAAELDVEVSKTSLNFGTERYEQYAERYKNEWHPNVQLRLNAFDYAAAEGMSPRLESSLAGEPALITDESGAVYWLADIPESGMYHIAIRYYPLPGNDALIERQLRIDGELPFEEAGKLVFSRIWRNEFAEPLRDKQDNELRSRQIEEAMWQTTLLRDADGYYREPFSFYLSKGQHKIELVSNREPAAIGYIELRQEKPPEPYESIRETYMQNEYHPTEGLLIKIQGEDAVYKSNPSLYALNDRSSPATEPYHASKMRMNTIGGVNWRLPGQWLIWEVDVPEDGLYEVGMRFKQNMARGINVVRRMYIDNQVPFAEADAISFPYSGTWQVQVTGDSSPYLYYLTKGTHEIKLELTMGELSDIIRLVRGSIQELNALYLDIITITGTVPDPYRDYQLEDSIPDMAEVFRTHAQKLLAAAEQMDRMVGETSASTAILKMTAYQLEDIADRPETIASRLTNFKDNVSSLGTWLLTVNEQPLEIDYLFIKSPNEPAPSREAGLARKVMHEVHSFFRSFTENYNTAGEMEQEGEQQEAIRVWITSGRDQAQLIRSLINNSFTPETGIAVELQLVAPEVVLPATLTGKSPDVALTMGDVINFAMRNALEDLSQFSEFEQVSQRFKESAFTGFRFRNGVYAIPETQVFPMLFYRKDILERLGLEPPETWDDLYTLIPELQKNNMNLAMPNVAVYEMMLYQEGGKYFQGDGIAAAIDEAEGLRTFRKWTGLYTNYRLPIEFDFINRFRTGEMPVGIADYTTYNFLTIFAPEIRGQWGFQVLPGTKQGDRINREALSVSSGAVMFRQSKHKENAWKFIQWWTDTEAQVAFGREMEAILGESARYPAANLQALKQLPWAASEYNQLVRQLEEINGKPMVPGGYMLDRHLLNAFYEVINDAAEPRETLENYVRTINEEITIKRKEFHLPTLE